MEKRVIDCQLRKNKGKGIVKKERKEGLIPAVVYSKDLNLLISLPHQAIKTLKNIHFSEGVLLELNIDGYENSPILALIKNVQYDPLTDEPIHLDFLKISMDEKVQVHVPIVLVGESVGVKRGGVLEQMLWELEIEVLPIDIPEKIVVNIENLDINQSIHVRDVKVSEGTRILEELDATVATVVGHEEEAEGEKETEEEPTAEPKVISKKKEETKESA